MLIRVLFVCLGNICRSPTAHGVFQKMVEERGLSKAILVDSAGTGAWHIGKTPDARATDAASQRGYDLSPLRARQVSVEDFSRFDHVIAMDESNLADLQVLKDKQGKGVEPVLFLGAWLPQASERNVPDPYYGGEEGFEHVLDLVEAASQSLLDSLIAEYPGLRGL